MLASLRHILNLPLLTLLLSTYLGQARAEVTVIPVHISYEDSTLRLLKRIDPKIVPWAFFDQLVYEANTLLSPLDAYWLKLERVSPFSEKIRAQTFHDFLLTLNLLRHVGPDALHVGLFSDHTRRRDPKAAGGAQLFSNVAAIFVDKDEIHTWASNQRRLSREIASQTGVNKRVVSSVASIVTLRVIRQFMATTLAHEFLHTRGFAHSDDPISLMHASAHPEIYQAIIREDKSAAQITDSEHAFLEVLNNVPPVQACQYFRDTPDALTSYLAISPNHLDAQGLTALLFIDSVVPDFFLMPRNRLWRMGRLEHALDCLELITTHQDLRPHFEAARSTFTAYLNTMRSDLSHYQAKLEPLECINCCDRLEVVSDRLDAVMTKLSLNPGN